MLEWKSLAFLGFPLYEISNAGQVRTSRGIRPGSPSGQGSYLAIDLYHQGKSTVHMMHRLVALAFVPNTDPETLDEVNHKDTNKRNNAADNLEWTSSSGNRIHSYAAGLNPRGERHPRAVLSDAEVAWVRSNYKPRDPVYGQSAMAKKFGVSQNNIHEIIVGKTRNKPTVGAPHG